MFGFIIGVILGFKWEGGGLHGICKGFVIRGYFIGDYTEGLDIV